MRREIKFRAWDESRKTFAMFDLMDIGQTAHNEPVVARWLTLRGGEPIEQFAGLHDRNGIEIYEGDILRDIDSGAIGYVDYNQSYYAFYEKTQVEGSERETQFDFQGLEYKVIGNIHENPELLDG